MGDPVSVAGEPRTRPSVPVSKNVSNNRRAIEVRHTIHGNAADDAFTQMLLIKEVRTQFFRPL
jgi:hypothetical protein